MTETRSYDGTVRNIVSLFRRTEEREGTENTGTQERKEKNEELRAKHGSWLIWLRRCGVALACLFLAGSLAVSGQPDGLGLVWSLRKAEAEMEHYASLLEEAVRHFRVGGLEVLDDRRLQEHRSELLALYRNALDAQYRGSLDAAIASYSAIVAQSGVDADLLVGALYNRGIAYDRTGKANLALADLDSAIALAPNYGEAYQNRATVRHRSHDLVGAFEDYSKAYDLLRGDERKFAAIGRAVVLVQSGNLRSARVDLTTALSLDPDFSLARKILRDVDAGLAQRTQVSTPDGLQDDPPKSHAPVVAVTDSVGVRVQNDSSKQAKKDSSVREEGDPSAQAASETKNERPAYFVQLGALASESAAEVLAKDSRPDLREIGGNIELQIRRGAAANGQVVYRVWVGPVAGPGEARQLCRDLKERSRDCFVVRPKAAKDDNT